MNAPQPEIDAFMDALDTGAHLDRSQSDEIEPDAPFLSVLLRTQGRRPHTLRDALLCLLAQTDQDFELLVLSHTSDSAQHESVESAVTDLPASLQDRTRILQVTGGGRARPLNCGLDEARGTYIVVLDDDDTVFGNWIEVFHQLSNKAPGRILRTVTASQAIEPEQWSDDRPGVRTVGPILKEWPDHFNLLHHIAANRTPFMSWAFPRRLVTEFGIRFDESLAVCEDWDVLLRGATLCGVIDSPETTALYRRWQSGDGSFRAHTESEWVQAAQDVIESIDKTPTLLPAGSLAQLQEMQRRLDKLEAEKAARFHPLKWVRNQNIGPVIVEKTTRIARHLRNGEFDEIVAKTSGHIHRFRAARDTRGDK
ncbi:glycosyltransferase family A protein [Rhodococcus sp. NPDC003383]